MTGNSRYIESARRPSRYIFQVIERYSQQSDPTASSALCFRARARCSLNFPRDRGSTLSLDCDSRGRERCVSRDSERCVIHLIRETRYKRPSGAERRLKISLPPRARVTFLRTSACSSSQCARALYIADVHILGAEFESESLHAA